MQHYYASTFLLLNIFTLISSLTPQKNVIRRTWPVDKDNNRQFCTYMYVYFMHSLHWNKLIYLSLDTGLVFLILLQCKILYSWEQEAAILEDSIRFWTQTHQRSKLDAFFCQIKSFRRFRLAFGFGLQTFYLIDFS